VEGLQVILAYREHLIRVFCSVFARLSSPAARSA
jgi:hypothetical protein